MCSCRVLLVASGSCRLSSDCLYSECISLIQLRLPAFLMIRLMTCPYSCSFPVVPFPVNALFTAVLQNHCLKPYYTLIPIYTDIISDNSSFPVSRLTFPVPFFWRNPRSVWLSLITSRGTVDWAVVYVCCCLYVCTIAFQNVIHVITYTLPDIRIFDSTWSSRVASRFFL